MVRKFVIIGLALAIMAGLLQLSPAPKNNAGKIRIGAPDDTSGLIIHYLTREKGLAGTSIQNSIEPLSIKDCCSSATQWALSAEEVDIAVMCPDAAATLIAKDPRYQIVSECTVNTDIVILRPGVVPKTIGVAQNRSYQADIVRALFDCEPVNMLLPAIPYAYEKQAVDGVVIDVLKSLALRGERQQSWGNNVDRLTSVLVVRKDFMRQPRYQEFVNLYKEAVNELNNPEILRTEIKKIKGIDVTREDMELWNRFKIRFRYTIAETPGQ